MVKDLAYYMTLNYPTEVDRGEEKDGIVVAFHPDLPGCVAQGSTPNEALTNLDEARAAWIEAGLADHQPIPEPQDDNYSGKILVRMPPSLHAAIARRAGRQGVSINHSIVATLAESIGFSKAVDYMERIREEMSAVILAQPRPPVRQLPSAPTTSASRSPSQSQLLNPFGPKRGTH